MTIVVAVSDNPEGAAAVRAAIDEARGLRDRHVVAVNTGHTPLDVGGLAGDLTIELVFPDGRGDHDPANAVLGQIAEHDARLLVIGIRRRSAIGKALLGSLSQKLLLHATVPVLTVKVPEHPDEDSRTHEAIGTADGG
ncbi:universal stress protein [Gordonia amarae]|uniref:UspA domain-containing protein n=2 Tax=Gordonia amarae TaxID=36821 RepID=G7GUS4_9ACTN|nr:universal stress protein [Gordonia amarae]MCS3876911.1 nucleotide-binding universal stress UspA family protein [Gordonia amarae]QHN15740.1 universal stress protein [Gordonia amarae]QHN20309.1 universal stress protein [Gordonia amarae]QHN29160.1 universal stress protein [Gordonia amarae]QHN37939.1 universal stress protein [Gordonia amarae]